MWVRCNGIYPSVLVTVPSKKRKKKKTEKNKKTRGLKSSADTVLSKSFGKTVYVRRFIINGNVL